MFYAAQSKMFELNLPKAEIKLENRNGKPSIWDQTRKKWLQLTPEEYVRQHFVHYLIHTLGYPASLISIERGIEVVRLSRRTDIVVYDKKGHPFLLIECKAPQVTLTHMTSEQIAAYNLTIKAPYLAMTNGFHHYFFQIDFASSSFSAISQLPSVEELYGREN